MMPPVLTGVAAGHLEEHGLYLQARRLGGRVGQEARDCVHGAGRTRSWGRGRGREREAEGGDRHREEKREVRETSPHPQGPLPDPPAKRLPVYKE